MRAHPLAPNWMFQFGVIQLCLWINGVKNKIEDDMDANAWSETRGVCFAAHHDSFISLQMICFDVAVRRFTCDYFATMNLISSQIKIKFDAKHCCWFNIFVQAHRAHVRFEGENLADRRWRWQIYLFSHSFGSDLICIIFVWYLCSSNHPKHRPHQSLLFFLLSLDSENGAILEIRYSHTKLYLHKRHYLHRNELN